MNKKIVKYEINYQIDSLKLMKRQAMKIDSKLFSAIRSRLKNGTMTGNLDILFLIIQKKYELEKGEIFKSPREFWETNGDCDCQAIFFASYFLYCGFLPSDLYFVLADENGSGWHHVFLVNRALKNNKKALDCLPGYTYTDYNLTKYKYRKYYRVDKL